MVARHLKARLVLLANISLLCACSALSPQPTREEAGSQTVIACNRYYHEFTNIIEKHHVKDAQTTAVGGHPYLHVNRFLSSLRPRLDQPDKLNLWLKLAAQLALQTNTIEINNLPPGAQQELVDLSPAHLQDLEPAGVATHCSHVLLQYDLTSPINQQHILRNANVPDDYHTWQRIVGLYPLVALPVAAGINKWHKESTSVLNTPTANLPIQGTLVRYHTDTQSAYTSFDEIHSALLAAKQNALQIPLPDEQSRQRLFATFSPLWEVDTMRNDDKIGAPVWSPNAPYADIDTVRPSVFTLISHAYFYDEILLQLNYIVWFPSRPCTSSLDFLCGHIDGLTWRVTLGTDGQPLIYDVIHNCGCYHTFFPTRFLQRIPSPRVTVDSRSNLDETAFSPVQAPHITPPQQLVLRIAPTSHHIESVYVHDEARNRFVYEDVSASWENYHSLRSLPYNAQHYNRHNNRHNNRYNKSLFPENAIVAGSQRKERWFFWPLGVPSAGAMRQWGNHATAFIGRRHFDEPYLFENSFTPVKP
jgi:hypothetical protein